MNELKYIVVQAGGKGTRLETLTTNKPKALVPVDNLPMIFHIFKRYPKAKFIVIDDYKKEVMHKYLDLYAKDYEISIVDANKTGTCSGISRALEQIPDDEPFMLIWCDLVLSKYQEIPVDTENNYIGISKDFTCRWSYISDEFVEEPSSENGVAGLFLFKNKKQIKDVPDSGEFVRWLSKKGLKFQSVGMFGGLEIGTMLSYFQNELNKRKCRPFNKIEFKNGNVIKTPLDKQGEKLADDEISWYKKINELGFNNIPKIIQYRPLIMNEVRGKNLYDYPFLTPGFKRAILKKVVTCLNSLHGLCEPVAANYSDCEETYVEKTFKRLSSVSKLVPFAEREVITINGLKCPNVLFLRSFIESEARQYYPEKFFLIHGDCTFHNILLETETVEPILIDPRGYFGQMKFYGDVDYDWAKLYYSVVGDYDQFNKKNFSLVIDQESVDLTIVSNSWKAVEQEFFILTKANEAKIKLLHALIWLSLTTYAWEDYDSICGAFYKGLIELRRYLEYTGRLGEFI